MNKEKQFTPGPWRRDNEFPLHIFEAQAQSDAICELYDMKRDAETEANARLIAAAPEMYGLLSDFVEARDNAGDESEHAFEAIRITEKARNLLQKINNDGQ